MAGMLGRKKLYSAPEKIELEYLRGPEDPGQFHQELLSQYGPEVTLDQALAWVRIQGFGDAILHELRWYFGETGLQTVWKSQTLHRPLRKSAWKQEIRWFHRRHGVRAHPAFLILSEAYLEGTPLPVHDRDSVLSYLAPLLPDTPAQGVDFSQTETDYHDWIRKMLERMGQKVPRRFRGPPTKPQ